jgi:hypothetical protein
MRRQNQATMPSAIQKGYGLGRTLFLQGKELPFLGLNPFLFSGGR